MRFGDLLFLMIITAALFGVQAAFADATNSPALPPPAATNGFSPGLGIAAFIIITVLTVACLLLFGFGLAIGVIACALAGALTAFGILSSSVTIAFLRRSPASGFRAMFIQLGAAAGIPCGIGAMWLVAWLVNSSWSTSVRFLVGGACGLVGGVVVALLFNFAWSKAAQWLLGKYESRSNS